MNKAFWMFGIVLVISTALGAGYILHAPGSEGPTKQAIDKQAITANNGEAPSVVCTGLVDVEGGVARLFPSIPGQVVSVLVKENETVSAGQVVLTIDDRQYQAKLREAQAGQKEAELRLQEAKLVAPRQELLVKQQQESIKAAKSLLEAAQEQQKLLINKSKKPEVFPIHQEDLNAAVANIKTLQAKLDGEELRLKELQLKDPKIDVDRADQNIAAKKEQIEQAKIAIDDCKLKAKTDGVILRVFCRAGEVLGPQLREPAIQLCPSGPRIVRAEVTQEFADRVKLGQSATLVDSDLTSTQAWHGKVTQIADWYAPQRNVSQELFQLNQMNTLQFIVTLDANQPPLRINQKMRVMIGQLQKKAS